MLRRYRSEAIGLFISNYRSLGETRPQLFRDITSLMKLAGWDDYSTVVELVAKVKV